MSTIVLCLLLSLIDYPYLCETFRQLLRHIYNACLEWAEEMWWSMLKFFFAVSLDSACNHATILNPHGPRKVRVVLAAMVIACLCTKVESWRKKLLNFQNRRWRFPAAWNPSHHSCTQKCSSWSHATVEKKPFLCSKKWCFLHCCAS